MSLTDWNDFLARQTALPPLRYIHGMRHPVEPETVCGMHTHPEFEIVYHPEGRGFTALTDGSRLPFREGYVVIYPPGAGHDQEMEEKGEDYCIKIAPTGEGGLPRDTLWLPRIESRSLREDLHLLSRGFLGLSHTEQAIYDLRATALLLELVHIACTRSSQAEANPAEQHVLKAEQYIRERFAKIRSLAEVAAHLGVSHDHLRHIFKTLRGKSLVRHLNEVRIERAGTLLRHSRLPVKQIAALCGFKDEYYFATVFRQLTGTTPGGHRRME